MSIDTTDRRHDCLRRKLALLLGSKKDWFSLYCNWCAENEVSATQMPEDHHINLFVKQHREKVHAAS